VVPTRAIGLSFALFLAGAPAVRAQTLLETVLYVVSTHEARDTDGGKITIAQDGESIHSKLFVHIKRAADGAFLHTELASAVSVKRITDCKFAVNYRGAGFLYTAYTVDFSFSDLEGAHLAGVRNAIGDLSNAIVIPRTKYCLAVGRPYLNDIGAGSCSDTFAAVPVAVLDEGGVKMLLAVHRLRNFCVPKVS
jgi:hypothetical protein